MGSEGKQQDRRRRRSKEPSGGGNGRPTHKTRPLDRLHRERKGMIKASTHETRARSSSRTAKLAAKSGKGINRLAKVNKKKEEEKGK